jgi:uncharacterized protein YsxB (DUF464 family)
MRPIISGHSEFDKHGYWAFERNSRLPLGYFGRGPINVDAVVVGVCIVCAAFALILVAITGAL